MTILLKHKVYLHLLIEEQCYFLNNITVRCAYEDGKRTSQIIGYVYTVTNTDTFDQISVFVEQQNPLLPLDKFESLRSEGAKVFVQFQDAVIRPYYSERTKQIEDSIRAKSVQHLEGI